jgi:hypothetical protein
MYSVTPPFLGCLCPFPGQLHGLINTRKHRREASYKEISDLLQSAHHCRYGFRPSAVSFAGAIGLYCLIALSVFSRFVVMTLGASLMCCTLVTIFWQRETRWGHDVEGVSLKRFKPRQRVQIH